MMEDEMFPLLPEERAVEGRVKVEIGKKKLQAEWRERD